MSRKKKAHKRKFSPDNRYNSAVIAKLVNSIMYDGKKVIAEKIVYDALEKLKAKSKEEPIKTGWLMLDADKKCSRNSEKNSGV